jgi:hypothetical protein
MGINKIGGVTLDVSAGNPKQTILIDVSAETGDLTTGAAKKTFRLPYNFNLSDVRASVNTAPVGSNILVDINQNGTSILNTKINIDVTEESSTLSDTSYSLKNPFLSNDDEITVDVDQVGSSTAGSGLKLLLIGTEITASDSLYHLSASATNVDEGNSVVYNMHTFNVADSTNIPYTISGIAAGDISQSLTGNFSISSNAASLTINVVADATTEGVETMTLTSQSLAANVVIADTSQPAAATNYSFNDNLSGNQKQISYSSMSPQLAATDFTNGTAGSFTFSVWMNNDSLSRYRDDWVTRDYSNKIQIEVRSSYVRFVHKTAATSWQSNYVWITQNTGTWYHYCFSVDTNTGKFTGYVNGANKSVATNTAIETSIWSGTSGGWNVVNYVGFIDNVAIYDGVLSDSDVAALYGSGTAPDLSALSSYTDNVDWWKFDNDVYDGTGDLITGEKGHDISIGNNVNNANLLSTNTP